MLIGESLLMAGKGGGVCSTIESFLSCGLVSKSCDNDLFVSQEFCPLVTTHRSSSVGGISALGETLRFFSKAEYSSGDTWAMDFAAECKVRVLALATERVGYFFLRRRAMYN